MSTTMLIPLAGVFCVAVAALLLSPNGCRGGDVSSPEDTERLITEDEIDSARSVFVRTRGVITAVRAIADRGADYREIELDVMVSRRGGGQFPASETAVVPAGSLAQVGPGSVVVAYYRADDETSVAVCLPPA